MFVNNRYNYNCDCFYLLQTVICIICVLVYTFNCYTVSHECVNNEPAIDKVYTY